MKTEKIGIEGMHCGHCADLVKNSLSIVDGVKAIDVKVGLATVEFDENVTEREELEKAVTRFGYKIRDY
jgi:copper chaperone CopZ